VIVVVASSVPPSSCVKNVRGEGLVGLIYASSSNPSTSWYVALESIRVAVGRSGVGSNIFELYIEGNATGALDCVYILLLLTGLSLLCLGWSLTVSNPIMMKRV